MMRAEEAERPRAWSVVKSAPWRVGDLQSFILDAMPYGKAVIDDIENWVSYDGSSLPSGHDDPSNSARPPLYWYFDGDCHQIGRSLTFRYTYKKRNEAGYEVALPDEIYIGIEAPVDDAAPYAPAVMRNGRPPGSIGESIAGHPTKINTVLTRALTDLGIGDFGESHVRWVDFAGPARDAVPSKPFDMTIEDMVRKPEEFNKLLFWQVGGRPQRVAKAIRIQCIDESEYVRHILIGYQGGSGSFPG